MVGGSGKWSYAVDFEPLLAQRVQQYNHAGTTIDVNNGAEVNQPCSTTLASTIQSYGGLTSASNLSRYRVQFPHQTSTLNPGLTIHGPLGFTIHWAQGHSPTMATSPVKSNVAPSTAAAPSVNPSGLLPFRQSGSHTWQRSLVKVTWMVGWLMDWLMVSNDGA